MRLNPWMMAGGAGYSLPMISAMSPPFVVCSRATLCLASPSKQLARPSKISRRFAPHLCVGPWFLPSMGRRGRRIDCRTNIGGLVSPHKARVCAERRISMSRDTNIRPATRVAVLGLDAVDWCILMIGIVLVGLILLSLA
jgi:hypothetical protein